MLSKVSVGSEKMTQLLHEAKSHFPQQEHTSQQCIPGYSIGLVYPRVEIRWSQIFSVEPDAGNSLRTVGVCMFNTMSLSSVVHYGHMLQRFHVASVNIYFWRTQEKHKERKKENKEALWGGFTASVFILSFFSLLTTNIVGPLRLWSTQCELCWLYLLNEF